MAHFSQCAPDLGVIDAIEAIARERMGHLEQMRDALEIGDDPRALEMARRLVGMSPKPGRS